MPVQGFLQAVDMLDKVRAELQRQRPDAKLPTSESA
jgi:hypothetical protein